MSRVEMQIQENKMEKKTQNDIKFPTVKEELMCIFNNE